MGCVASRMLCHLRSAATVYVMLYARRSLQNKIPKHPHHSTVCTFLRLVIPLNCFCIFLRRSRGGWHIERCHVIILSTSCH